MMMLQKIILGLFLSAVSIGFPLYILFRPPPPRLPVLVQHIERMHEGGLRWKATFPVQPIAQDTRPAVEFLQKILHTAEEPLIRIDGTDAVIEFRKHIDEVLIVESLARLKTETGLSDFSIITSPWMEKEEDLKPILTAIRSIDHVPDYLDQNKLTVVQHPHNAESRYVMVSFDSSATR